MQPWRPAASWTLVLPNDDGYCRVALWLTVHTIVSHKPSFSASVSGGLLTFAAPLNHDLNAVIILVFSLTLSDCTRPAAMADVQLEQPVLTPVGKPLSLMYAEIANTLRML